MKILVADDDSDQVMLRCMLLERSGFQTLQASDPATALALAQAERPDCAIVDLRFPTEESGFRLLRELKSLNSGMHLFLLTGYKPSRIANRAEADLVDEVLEKGSAAKLVQKLKALERQGHM
jgi:two-component system response regulator RegA